MFRLDVQPASGELAFRGAWALAPDVTVAVTDVRVDEYETATGSTRPRLAIAVEARNGSEEPFELVNDFGLLDGAGEFHRHVWVDPEKRPQALAGVRVIAPGEALSGEVFVSLELGEGEDSALYIPAFGGLAEHDCTNCGHDQHEFLPQALWQPVRVHREPVLGA